MTLKVPSGLLEFIKPPQQSVSLTLPAPYCDLQRDLIQSNAKLAVFCTGTKVGKSLGAAIRLLRLSYTARRDQDAIFRIISPTYKQAKIIYKYINRLVPERFPGHLAGKLSPEQIAIAEENWKRFTLDRSRGDLSSTWPHNMAAIECVHGTDPESTLEGERVHGQIIDEAAKCHEQVFSSAMTTTTQTGGSTFLVSTPKGKGYFYKIAMDCKEQEAWAIKKGIPPTMIFRTLPTVGSPYVNADIIENARRTLPSRIFKQLYLAEFQDDGSVFTGLDYAFDNAREFSFDNVHLPPRHDSNHVFIGVDWAKTEDYSVFVALNERGELIAYKKSNEKSYPTQVAALWAFCDYIKGTAQKGDEPNPMCEIVVEFDQMGVGEAVGDIIGLTNHKGYTINGIKWSNQIKENYVNDLILSFEEKALKLLPWGSLQTELMAYEVETSRAGNPIFGAPEGQHDDCVTALLLANKLLRHSRKQTSGVILFDNFQKQVEYMYYSLDDLLED